MTRQLLTRGFARDTPIADAFQSEFASHTARAAPVVALLCAALLITSCLASRVETNTAESSTEQLLLAASVERAIARLELPDVRGKRVFVDLSAIPSQHSDYLQSLLATRLGQNGAQLVLAERAELRIVALVGSIGTDSHRGSFGLPPLPIPALGVTPELPLLLSERQRGWTQVRVATWDASGRLVAASPIVTERAHYDVFRVLFLEFRRNDVYPAEASAGRRAGAREGVE